MPGRKLNKRILTLNTKMDPEMVGWKFARLKTMEQHKLPVPPFFCLTRSYYENIIGDISGAVNSELDKLNFNRYDDIKAAAERIRQYFLAIEFSDQQAEEIFHTFDTNFGSQSLVSVRSSTIGMSLEQSEDSATTPFAGMSDSFLYVTRDQLLEKIRLCWASGYNPESMLYRYKQGFSISGFGVAVGIQQMIFGERSFVLFTCNPTTVSREMIITAGYGIGEGVVQESVDVDHYFINAKTQQINRRLSTKKTMLTFDRSKGAGLTKVDVPKTRQDPPCLTDAEIKQLVQQGQVIEALFAAPQDIEGTFTDQGSLFILQSRPIAIDYSRYRLWSSANVSESFPGVTTPLTYSFAQVFYHRLNYDYLRRSGVPLRKLNEISETTQRLVGFIHGRIYHNITAFFAMLSLSPLLDSYKQDWERLVAELDSFYHSAPVSNPGPFTVWKRRLAFIYYASIAFGNYLTLDRNFSRFKRWWEGLMVARRGICFKGQHPLVLDADYHEVWRQAGHWWGITLINYQYMVLFHKICVHLIGKWQIDPEDDLLSNLLCGGQPLMGCEIVMSAIQLADQVRADPVLAKIFAEMPPREIWEAIERGELFSPPIAVIKEHLHRYGDRGLQELKLEQANLRDTPWELIQMIKNYVGMEVRAESLREVERENRRKGERQLKQALRGHPFKRALIKFLAKGLMKFLNYREEGRYMRSELFGYSKNIFRAIGQHLNKEGIIADADDIFYLHKDEIFGYLDGSGVSHDLDGLTQVRKRDGARFKEQQPLKEFTTADILAQSIPMQEAPSLPDDQVCGRQQASTMKGLGSSRGKVRGYARVVVDPSLSSDLGKDSILIARETDPGWLYLMLSAKGIVVERGSMLSHTAITGRKFGIPTIVGVPDATRLISDGRLMEIDGSSGLISLL